MVGHLLEYHPGVAKLKEIADSGELGDIHYIYSNRLNLGKLRADENALWSLGAHDVSVRAAPRRRGARTRSRRAASPTCARASRTSSSASCASRPASPPTCTSPGSTRTRSAASRSSARKRMATFDDMDLERKVTVYDKGFDQDADVLRRVHHPLGRHLEPARSRNREPLRIECEHFVDCLREGRAPRLRRRDAACASCACSRRCRSGSTRRGGSSVRPSDRAPGPAARRGRADRARACGFGAYVVVHAGTVHRRRLRDPGRRGARQAAEARAPLDRAARARRRRCVLGAGRGRSAPARSCFAGAEVGDGGDPRRPVATCASARGSAAGTVIGRGIGGRQRRRRSARACGSRPTST